MATTEFTYEKSHGRAESLNIENRTSTFTNCTDNKDIIRMWTDKSTSFIFSLKGVSPPTGMNGTSE